VDVEVDVGLGADLDLDLDFLKNPILLMGWMDWIEGWIWWCMYFSAACGVWCFLVLFPSLGLASRCRLYSFFLPHYGCRCLRARFIFWGMGGLGVGLEREREGEREGG